MELDMLRNRIEVLVARSEASKLGPDMARGLLNAIRRLEAVARMTGFAQGQEVLRKRIEHLANKIGGPDVAEPGGENGGRVHTGGAESTHP